MSKEVVLSDKEEMFVDLLVKNGGKLQEAAEEAGYHPLYCYTLRKRLAKHIAEAAQEFLALQSVKAAKVVLEHMDKEMPNPIHLQAAKDVLDRAGVVRKPVEEERQVIRANIFILPEKRPLEAIDVEYLDVTKQT